MNINKKGVYHLIKLPVAIFFISSLFLYSCEESPDEFTLGEEFIESQTDINLIDTFSVNLYTVLLDTIYTSGTGKILIGNYQDTLFGKISSNSFFQIGIPGTIDVEDEDIYDSLNLVIRYSNYSFGDTSRTQNILVHKLTEKINPDENGDLNSKTIFNYDSNPIGSIFYNPKPNNSDDTLFIKISDNLGIELFAKLKENSVIFTDDESFISYFNGLLLKTNESYPGSIIGFNAYSTALVLYSTRYNETTETIKNVFGLSDSTKQFNNVTHDFSGTNLSTLVNQSNALSTSETGGLSYLQGSLGLVIRIDFPSLQEIFLLERGKVTEAKLSFAPLKNSYNEFDLPPQLIIYKSDKLNRKNGFLYSTSTLAVDDFYHEETTYSFDITEYLTEELSDFYVDPESGLLITLTYNNMISSFNRLITDVQNQKPRLKIYYLTY